MKISKRTIEILNNFASINSNIVIKPGNIFKTISPARNVLSIAKVDETFPLEFGIHDLGEFLKVMNLVNDPDLIFEKEYVVVGDANGKSRVKYFYSEPEMLTTVERDVKMPDAEIKFTIDKFTLSNIIKAASTLECKTIIISPSDGNIRLTVKDVDDPTGNSYSVDIEADFDTGVNFSLVLNVNNIKTVMNDFNVEMSSKLITHWKSKESPIEYFIALEKSSKYGE